MALLKSEDMYEMPIMMIKFQDLHDGDGVKTLILNMVDITQALNRPASYTTRYLGYELGAQTGTYPTFHLHGAHDVDKLIGLIDNFISKSVQCYDCHSRQTEIIVHSEKVYLKCAACGFLSAVDMGDKPADTSSTSLGRKK